MKTFKELFKQINYNYISCIISFSYGWYCDKSVFSLVFGSMFILGIMFVISVYKVIYDDAMKHKARIKHMNLVKETWEKDVNKSLSDLTSDDDITGKFTRKMKD